MATIGNLGSLIVFEVSGNKVLTFRDMKQSVKGRWADHAVIGEKPIPEFLGADKRSISLDIHLTALHGVRPRITMEAIEEAAETGTPYTLVIGGRKVGANQWVVTEVSEAWGAVIQDGRLASANLTIQLSEYR